MVEPARGPRDMLYASNDLHRAVDRLEEQSILDGPAGALQRIVYRLVPTGRVRDVLSGTWLGHPLHPMLTDLPIGFWTSAFVVDVVSPRRGREVARRLVGLGVVSALPTALSGATDWSDTEDGARRVGIVHAAANSVALGCYTASWWARRRGHTARGVMLGLFGATAATVGGYLGGDLLQRLRVGVNITKDDALPDRITANVDPDTLPVDSPTRVDKVDVMLVRHRGEVHALSSTCPHRGGPLDQGLVIGDCVECPWHASRFALRDGSVRRGPSVWPVRRWAVHRRSTTSGPTLELTRDSA